MTGMDMLMGCPVLATTRTERFWGLLHDLMAGDPIAWAIVVGGVVLSVGIGIWKKRRAAS